VLSIVVGVVVVSYTAYLYCLTSYF